MTNLQADEEKKSLKSKLLVYLQTEDKAIIAPRTPINNPLALKEKQKTKNKQTSPKPKPKLWMLFSYPSLLFYMASRYLPSK